MKKPPNDNYYYFCAWNASGAPLPDSLVKELDNHLRTFWNKHKDDYVTYGRFGRESYRVLTASGVVEE